MKDNNDNSTAELELNDKVVFGRPGRKITKYNFVWVVEALEKIHESNKNYQLTLDDEDELISLFYYKIPKGPKSELYMVLRDIQNESNSHNLYKRKIESLTCAENENLADLYIYKRYNEYIAEAESKIDDLKANLSNELDDEIELLQKIVNGLDKKIWDKILGAKRQRFNKLVNRKSKLDIDPEIFQTMKSEKERHGMSWDEYMSALLSLSDKKLDEALAKEEVKDKYFTYGIDYKWL